MPAEEPTELEQKISVEADRIVAEHMGGYRWSAVDVLLEALDLGGPTRCKRASGSGRAANVLTESNDKDITLYVVFIVTPYTIDKFVRAAASRIERFRNVNAVAVADRTTGSWRVRAYLERDGTGLAEMIKGAFPLVDDAAVTIVPDVDDGEDAAFDPPSMEEDVFVEFSKNYTGSLDHVPDLPERFRSFSKERGLDFDVSTSIDALACVLSSQLILFAGPSGTGKSRLARSLAAFFSPEDYSAIIESRRQLIGPEDVAGYFSNIGGRFALTSDTVELLALHEACVAGASEEAAAAVPFMLVEEANLSPIEGYLAPAVHGLSSPTSTHLRWSLHAHAASIQTDEYDLKIPPTLLFGPFPRVLATINVDASSPSPAAKVTARGVVILVEAAPLAAPETLATQLLEISNDEPGWDPDDLAHGALGNPSHARSAMSATDLAALVEAFQLILSQAGHASMVSRRDLVKAANYMAYFRLLAQSQMGAIGDAGVVRLAAENAFLHVVLPALSPAGFARAATQLLQAEVQLASPPATDEVLGGLLAPRIARLGAELSESMFPEAVDFWTALS